MSKSDMLGTSTLADVARLLKTFSDRLAGEDGEVWIAAFKRFLRKENPWPVQEPTSAVRPVPEAKPAPTPVVPPTFKVWKTITIGGKSRDELRLALEAAGFKVGDWAWGVMVQKAFVTESEPREIDITVLSVAELGYPKGATTSDIWARAKDFGLELCPSSLGPHLRLAYGDQPLDEWIWVAMEAIIGPDGCPDVFRVEHVDGGRWLNGSVARQVDRWRPGNRFAFVVSRK